MPSDLSPRYDDAIAGIESGGNYGLLGPVTKGDRAYGKYQVMGSNVGPWTKQYFGQELTPQQFLDNPAAQDAVFQGEFGRLAGKYGPEGAARAWFAGEGGMNNPNAKDVLGTTVAAYGAKFMRNLGQPAALGAAPGAPLQLTPQVAASGASSLPAFGWSPAAQQQAQPAQQSAPMPQIDMSAPMLNAPPIYYAQRRQPSLAPLQAVLAPHMRGFSLKG